VTEPVPDVYYESEEDEFGPAHSRPWGCCFGHCPTEFSVAFREYHGLEEAYQARLVEIERLRKENWKKCNRKKPCKRGDKTDLLDFLRSLEGKGELTKHMVPRRLRLRYFSKRRLKLSPQQIERNKVYDAS
jgi:hypothetical protein